VSSLCKRILSSSAKIHTTASVWKKELVEYGNDIEDAYKEIRDWKEEFFVLPSWPFLAGEIWGGFGVLFFFWG
jgi:hypothetical protein